MVMDKRLWKLPDGRDWLRVKLDLFLMGGAMLSKSLIQFSVDGRGCVPPCFLTWDQTMMEVMKIMATSFKRFHARTAALSAPDPVASHCGHTPLPETSGHSRANLGQSLVGSLLLSPGSWWAQGFVWKKKRFCLKKGEHQIIDAFELWCWRRLLRVLGLQGVWTSPS